jgi:heat shock protein HslJ
MNLTMKKKLALLLVLVVILVTISWLIAINRDKTNPETEIRLPLPSESVPPSYPVSESPVEETPSKGTLARTSWQWVRTSIGADEFIVPLKPESFVISFRSDGRVSSSTDCNRMFGPYSAKEDGTLSVGPLASTLMYCEGSQESDYATGLQNSTAFTISPDGQQLILTTDTGIMEFKSVPFVLTQ